MTVTITPSGDNTCTLAEKTNSSSAVFPIPCAAVTLKALLRTLLTDPERSEAEAGAVMVSRYRDGVKVHVGSGTFAVRYLDLFPLVVEG